jgi:hypothetical protein
VDLDKHIMVRKRIQGAIDDRTLEIPVGRFADDKRFEGIRKNHIYLGLKIKGCRLWRKNSQPYPKRVTVGHWEWPQVITIMAH